MNEGVDGRVWPFSGGVPRCTRFVYLSVFVRACGDRERGVDGQREVDTYTLCLI